jgi:hypothetical protein
MSGFLKPFKVLPAMHGGGWLGLHVAVDYYIRPDALGPDSAEIVLTVEAENPEEFDGLVDELIAELEGLKAIARRKLEGWPVGRIPRSG